VRYSGPPVGFVVLVTEPVADGGAVMAQLDVALDERRAGPHDLGGGQATLELLRTPRTPTGVVRSEAEFGHGRFDDGGNATRPVARHSGEPASFLTPKLTAYGMDPG
jgi:hypothetical protein